MKMVRKVVLASGKDQIPGQSCQTRALSFHSHARAHGHGRPLEEGIHQALRSAAPCSPACPTQPTLAPAPKGAPSSPLLLRVGWGMSHQRFMPSGVLHSLPLPPGVRFVSPQHCVLIREGFGVQCVLSSLFMCLKCASCQTLFW